MWLARFGERRRTMRAIDAKNLRPRIEFTPPNHLDTEEEEKDHRRRAPMGCGAPAPHPEISLTACGAAIPSLGVG